MTESSRPRYCGGYDTWISNGLEIIWPTCFLSDYYPSAVKECSTADMLVTSRNGLELDSKNEHEKALELLKPIAAFIHRILRLSDAQIEVESVI